MNGQPEDPRSPWSALVGFVVCTYAVTWSVWLAVAFANGHSLVSGVGGPAFLVGVFAPSLVAIAMTFRSEGRTGVAQLLRPIGAWQVSPWYYLFAMTYLAATKLLAALLLRVITGAWPTFGDVSVPLILGALLVSTWVQAGEEIGWRGYALPRLTQLVGLGPASIALGLIWATWHLPLFFLAGSGSTGQSFPLYALHVTALTVAMTWLYWKTHGSLLLVMLMHASVNNTTAIVPVALPGAGDPLSFHASLVGWLTVAVSWVVAAPLLYVMRRGRMR